MPINDDVLVRNLLGYFKDISALRRGKEDEWIEDLRQFKAQYDPDILSKIVKMKGSQVYPNYTRSKVRPTIAKINSVFFPYNNKAWEIKLVKDQQFPAWLLQKAQEKYQQVENPTPDDLKSIVNSLLEEVKIKADKILFNQLENMNAETYLKSVNHSSVLYGTGILKGIMSKSKRKYNMVAKEEGVSQEEYLEYSPYVEYIPIWNVYPDMSTSFQDSLLYVFQLHNKVSKKALLNYVNYPGFDNKKITKYMVDHPKGDYTKTHWETQLQLLAANNKQTSGGAEIIGAYRLLEYWGYIDGKFLGEEEKYKPNKAYIANVWILGDQIIKKEVFPLDTPTSLYHFFYYEKDDSSIFGTGLPRILRGTQLSIGAASRMVIDNAASVIGPQIEINVDLLAPEQDVDSMHPRKRWYREGRGQEAQYPAIRAVNTESHIPEYLSIVKLFKEFGDEESNLPAFVWGNPSQIPTNTTATGMSQLSSNTNLTISDIVKGYEKENKKVLLELIAWNKQYNEEQSDLFELLFEVEGFGYETQIAKEVKLQALDGFSNSLKPEDSLYIKRGELLKERLRLVELPTENLLKTEVEVQEAIKAQQDIEAAELEKENKRAEIEYTRAKATHMLAKSKKTIDEDEKNLVLDKIGKGDINK